MKIEKYSDFNDNQLNESFWEDIKYGLSKLGRYKAGGKILGKKATDDASREEIKEIMKKESNKLLKQVHGEVLIAAPEFPNDRRKVTFLRGIIMYGQLYDSLVAAAKKDPKEEGYMSPEVVNEIIEDMRKVIKKFLDVDLKAVYSVTESRDNITEEEIFELNRSLEYDAINEEEEFLKKLSQLKDKAMDKLFGAKKGSDYDEEDGAGTSIAAKVAGVGKILTGLGIALVTTGAIVKLLREKGQRQSRAKTLNDLLQSLVPVEVGYKKGEESTGEGEGKGEETSNIPTEKSIYPLMIKNLTQLRSLISTSEGVGLEGESGISKDKELGKGKEKVKIKTPNRYKKVTAESLIFKFEDMFNEDKTFGKQRNVEVTKSEDYLTQAVVNIRKSIKSLKDEKDKGVGITYDFISAILDKKMDSNTKEPVKQLYSEIYDYLYGAKSKTLGEFAPLYKESVETISNKSKRQIVSEKMARFSKRSLQFEGEGFYGGMGEFGADLEDFNKTFKEIMAYFKAKSEVKESKIFRFKDL
jgi:hypothetical protein